MSALDPIRTTPASTDRKATSSTTPLRITKRDSPTSETRPAQRIALPRRNSASWRHVIEGGRVSKSPFKMLSKSSIPMPSKSTATTSSPVLGMLTRKGSGEKRPRPPSMSEAAENEHPALRKRRQSQGLQGLTHRKPVTKSPFKSVSVQNHGDVHASSADGHDDNEKDDLPPPPPPKERFETGRSSPLPPHRGSPSPVRPSLVSRRLHGPRSSLTKRERRKTVTFDETCDVMEYDVEEDSGSQPFDWVTDEDRDDDEDDDDDSDEDYDHRADAHDRLDDPHTQDLDLDLDLHDDPDRGPLRVQNADTDSGSEDDGAHHVGDDSIAGLVESMLEDARPHTPPHDDQALPDDLETEGGVPYGRTHHAERLAAAHQRRSESPLGRSPIVFPAPNPATSTPVHSRPSSPIGSVSPGSHLPLGRSTHSERVKAQKEKEACEVEEDLNLMPPSPSPAKRQSTTVRSNTESLIPRFELDAARNAGTPAPAFSAGDPFGASQHGNDIVDATVKSEPPLPSLPDTVFDMDEDKAEPRSSTESSHGPITPPTSPPRFGMSMGNASKDSLSRVLGTVHANASRDSINRALGISHGNASRDSLHHRGNLGMAHGNASRDSLLGRLRQGNASHDSLVSRGIGVFHGNQSRDSLPGRVSTPTNLARSTSPTANNSPFNASPFNRPSSRSCSPFARAESPFSRSIPRVGSSTDIHSASASPTSRGSPRITRENVQKILQKKHSIDSPLPGNADNASGGLPSLEPGPSTDTATNSPAFTPQRRPGSAASRIPAPKLTRDNPTYDGVMSLDPEPQPGDPPRPSITPRAASLDAVADSAGTPDRPHDPDDLGFVHLGDMRSALDRLMADVAGEARVESDGKTVVGLKVEAVTEGVKAGRHSLPDGPGDVTMQDVVSESPDPIVSPEQDREQEDNSATANIGMHIDLPSMGPEALLSTSFMSPQYTDESPEPPRPTSPRPPVVKDAIRTREELIKAKKREARRREEEEEDEFDEEGSLSASRDYFTPRRPLPVRRRSLSTSDADDRGRAQAMRRRATMISDGGLLDNVSIEDGEDDPLADSIDRELTRLKGGRTKYHVRQRSEIIHASSDDGHGPAAGDMDGARAWRMVRRPSDMNEYAQQLKQLQAQQGPGKAYAKVFVKVVGIRGLIVPVPQQPTAVSCTLNNGIHFVTTPDFQLGAECRMNQEFELIEQSKLEFTLAFKIRRDPHIIAQFKANQPPPAPAPKQAPPPASKGGLRNFFREKKTSKPTPPQPVKPPHRLQENLARYLKPDGTLARAFVAFKDIARRCDARLLETTFPLIGQRAEETEPPKNLQIGEVVLQVFRLPPLPGIPPELLPGSLEDCHRGMRSTAWHKVTYLEGTLTQNGGDCTSWRRRHFRIIGSNLIAFNDVTKKATTTIDLKKAIALEDDKKARDGFQSPTSPASPRSSRFVEFDVPYGIERSFRILFKNDQEIIFYADSDEEKKQWLDVLNLIVGRVPDNPLWAELLWQQQHSLQKQNQQPPSSSRHTPIPS